METDEAVILYEWLKHQRLVTDFCFIAAAAVLIYDYLLTIHLEITLIWLNSPWTYTKILFLLVRYIPMVALYLLSYNQLFLDVTEESCRTTLPLCLWLCTTSILLAETVLSIRTWAVWGRNRNIGFLLFAMVAGALIISCGGNAKFQTNMTFAPSPYPGFRGCLVSFSVDLLKMDFIALTVLEFVMLVLMAISAYRAYNLGDNRNQLAKVIYRDGVVFYAILLAAGLLNVIIMCVCPPQLRLMGTPMSCALWSVLTSRIVINIRDAGRSDTPNGPAELHDHENSDSEMLPLASRTGAPTSPQTVRVCSFGFMEVAPAVPVPSTARSSLRSERREYWVMAI